MTTSAADRFLNAYVEIEQYLRSRYENKSGFHEHFPTLLQRAAAGEAVIRRNKTFLESVNDLRNLLNHKREDGEYLATPGEATIRKTEEIARALTAPSTVHELFRRTVLKTTTETEIGRALALMHEQELSQVPVFRNNVFIGMLTTNTLARWIGAHVEDEILDLKISVEDALRYQENSEVHLFVPRTMTAPEVIDAFDKAAERGQRLTALLITQNGKETEQLLGIVTAYDLPEAIAKA